MARKFNFQWDPKTLAIGVDNMDKDHQKLILMMNDIYQLHKKKASRKDVEEALTALGVFVTEHFSREERYFETVPNYPDVDIHKAVHKKLLNKYGGFVQSYKEGAEMTEDFFFFLKAWLVAHIEGIDAKYAA